MFDKTLFRLFRLINSYEFSDKFLHLNSQGSAPPGQQYASPFGVAPGPSTTVVVQGGFDAGARFDVTGANIPVSAAMFVYISAFNVL